MGSTSRLPAGVFCWLRVDRVLGEWGIPKDSVAGRRHFGRCMKHRRKQESPKADWRAVERGWFLGDKGFKAELLAQVRERRRDHYGPELREADAEHAERVLREELRRRGWTEADLAAFTFTNCQPRMNTNEHE